MLMYPVSGTDRQLVTEISLLGCDPHALPIFENKVSILPVKIHGVPAALANIIKQEMISSKGDAAVHAKTISCRVDKTDIILLGSRSVYQTFLQKMEIQNYTTLLDLGRRLKRLLDTCGAAPLPQKTARGRVIRYQQPLVMGILNLNNNSFYIGSRYPDTEAAVNRALQMLQEGADIIDVGGESTRPGSEPVSEEEELARVVPVVEEICARTGAIVSVDTTKAAVAEAAMEAGAEIINDISALGFDPRMADVASRTGAVTVLMHMQGVPQTMQQNPHYENVLREVVEFFEQRVSKALEAGIRRENLILDPGFGFGKNLDHNLALLRGLPALRSFGLPVLAGISRKAMIGAILQTTPDQPPVAADGRLWGTLGAHAYAVSHGADIVRVHDVKEHRQMLDVLYRAGQI